MKAELLCKGQSRSAHGVVSVCLERARGGRLRAAVAPPAGSPISQPMAWCWPHISPCTEPWLVLPWGVLAIERVLDASTLAS